MVAPTALSVKPVFTPHLNLDYLPLANRDFQIKVTVTNDLMIKIYCLVRDTHLNQADEIGLWESNLPKYVFPQVHCFPKIIHQ